MKALCKICERAFELAGVTIDEDSGVEKGKGFFLLPQHEAVEGKRSTKIVSQSTGLIIVKICDGSLRPPSIIIH